MGQEPENEEVVGMVRTGQSGGRSREKADLELGALRVDELLEDSVLLGRKHKRSSVIGRGSNKSAARSHLVAETVAPGGNVQRWVTKAVLGFLPSKVESLGKGRTGKRVHVARGETAKSSVSKSSVTLSVELPSPGVSSPSASKFGIPTHDILHLEPEALDRLLVRVLDREVEERVVETATHQELEGEVVNPLGLLLGVVDWERTRN